MISINLRSIGLYFNFLIICYNFKNMNIVLRFCNKILEKNVEVC